MGNGGRNVTKITFYTLNPREPKIVAKRRNYQRIYHLSMIDQCCQEIKEAIVLLHQSGEHPTESRVCELISNPGYFRYRKVRLLYKQEVQSIVSRL